MEPKFTNRLIHESSPYLLQHAHNPVDWYPWGEEALERAKREDKPILLSIGYSSCHWCHVMEKESFENEAIAQLMNERFINIKVDREERPDLDELYMNAVQVMTGSGGWPMTVFLTPDLVPFHGGTYFPPEDRLGMPGFPKVLITVSNYYHAHRKEVKEMADQMEKALHQIAELSPAKENLHPGLLSHAFDQIRKQYDPVHGGFGRAPKFPNSMTLSFLLRYWKVSGEEDALQMVEKSLEKMAQGGIYDHLGGGFHRYSVDERWLIPHFEKMLYDNALLSKTYLESYRATKKKFYLDVAEEVLSYALREMRGSEGGFYSTQDADSEGREGTFYLWSKNEIKELLGKERGTPFCAHYGVTSQGNFEEGSSVLNVATPLPKVSELYGIPIPQLEEGLVESRKILFEAREKRTKPRRDEKILTSWNGLMISSLVDGFQCTWKEAFLKSAEETTQFILEGMKRHGRLMRVFHHGKWHIHGFSEDYAFFIQALIDLYETTFRLHYLEVANDLNEQMIRHFWDDESGGFFFTGKEHSFPIARSKSPYDHAIPSANSIAVTNLIRLGTLAGNESLKEKAQQIFRLFYRYLSEQPIAFSQMYSGLVFYLYPQEIGIIGSKKDPQTISMLKEVYLTYLPNKILSLRDPEEPFHQAWFPFLREKSLQERPTLFLCKGFTCFPPISKVDQLSSFLKEL